MARSPASLTLHGASLMQSPWFSNRWRLFSEGSHIADLERHPRLHTSTAAFEDGTEWALEPHGWGVVRIVDRQGTELARVTRRSWVGRRWELGSPSWAYDLVSVVRPRHWAIEVGGTPIAGLRGSLISYNEVHIDCMLALPVGAAMLAWHVVARPWEAAAAPRALVPLREPGAEPEPEAA